MTDSDSRQFPDTPPPSDDLNSPRPPRWSSRIWKWGLLLLLVILVAVGIYFARPGPQEPRGSGRAGGGPPNRPLPVGAEPAKTANVNVYLSALGTVTSQSVAVHARVDGQLMSVHFREGQTVKGGDLLAEIDPRPFQVQLTQAEGQMARDQAQLQNAHVDLERYRTLYAQDSIEKQKLDTQEALVRQYEGAVKVDQGQIDNARLQLVYSRVTAPASGRLGLRQVDPGNVVHASDSNGLVTITQIQPITVIYTLPEDSLASVTKRLREGAQLAVDAYDRDGKIKLASGALLSLDNQIDTTTGTVKLKAEFPNKEETLFPNQFVNVRMLLETRQNATVIPAAAVQRGSAGTFVYVVKDDQTVTVRPVKLGPVDGQNIAVESGVAPGETVVVDGADKLREGGKVELIRRDMPAAPAAGAPGQRGPRPDGAGKGDGKGKRGEGGQRGQAPTPQ